MFKKFLFLVVISSFFINLAYAEEYKFPLEGGKTYQITVSYFGKSIFFNENGSPWVDQWHLGNSCYSLDFDNPPCDEDITIVAIAPGVVEYVYTNSTVGYGYGVKIRHADNKKSLYAHFKNLPLVSVGNSVCQGQQIGKMGTTGNSFGTHLHFELRDSNNVTVKPEPMSGYTNFTAGTRYISDNYVRDQISRWDFNTTGWCENWTRTNIDDYSVGDGIFYINPGDLEPYITSPAISISAAKSALIISMASNAPDGVGAIYFTTATSPNWDEAKKVDFAIINDGKYHDYFVSMKSKTDWQGTITQIRIDPSNKGISYTNIDTIGIDFISLVQLDWNFNNAGNTDGWTMTNIENHSVGNGIFYIDPGALDPNITSPIISKNATEFNSLFIRMASNAPDRIGAIYFTTENFPNWNGNKRVPFTVLNDGKYYKYAIHMNSNPNWWGTITGIRIDPANTGIAGTGSDTIGIDCIHLY